MIHDWTGERCAERATVDSVLHDWRIPSGSLKRTGSNAHGGHGETAFFAFRHTELSTPGTQLHVKGQRGTPYADTAQDKDRLAICADKGVLQLTNQATSRHQRSHPRVCPPTHESSQVTASETQRGVHPSSPREENRPPVTTPFGSRSATRATLLT